MSIRKVYCSGAYTAPTRAQIDANIEAAKAVGREVRAYGYVPLVPHIAIVPGASLTWGKAMEECLVLLAFCDACLMFGPWRESRGALEELAFCEAADIPVFYSLEELVAGLEARP